MERHREPEPPLLDRHEGRLRAVRTLKLAPGDIETVDVGGLLEAAGGGDLHQVRPSTSSEEGGLLASGHVLMPDSTVMDLALTPRAKIHDTGTYLIPPLDGFEVVTTFVNLGEETAELFAHFSSDRGEYAFEPIEIPPGGTHRLDFEAIASGLPPDRLGRRLEEDFEWGFFQWLSRRGSTELLARTEAREHGDMDRIGFNCYGCCHEMPTGAVMPDSVGFDVGETRPFETLEYVDTCAGMTGPYHAYPDTFFYSAPLSWDGWTISTTGLTNQDVAFQDSGNYMAVTCTTRTRTFFGGGNATSDRCMDENGPAGYDEDPNAGGCPGQTSGCVECYTCCEQLKDVGECRCAFGGDACDALAAQSCITCKELCFGMFAETCQSQNFNCT